MPRLARVVVAGVPHHVTQRGNNRQDVFFTDDDRRLYLTLLTEECRARGVSILGYCLMLNHVHLIAVPRRAGSLASALGRTHWRYAREINRLHGRSGHLWQNRFYSSAMDARHATLAMRYVELNPVRAKACRLAWRYEWSSAAAHCGQGSVHEVLDTAEFDRISTATSWMESLRDGLDDEEVRRIRAVTRNGRPLGGDAWLSKLEARLGRRLRPLPVGRPRKPKRTVKRENRRTPAVGAKLRSKKAQKK